MSINGALQEAMALHRQGRPFEAEAGYRSILKRSPRHFDALYLLSVLRLQQGDTAEAFELMSAALEQNPRSAPARATLGSILLQRGRAEDALGCFDAVLADNADDIDARYNRAVILGSLGRVDQALVEYKRVLTARPNDVAAWFNCGNLLAWKDQFKEARDCYDRALALAPQFADALLNRGNALARLGHYDEALTSFERVLAIQPRHVEALNGRAIACKSLKRMDEALASCDQALAIKPDHVGALVTRGNVLLARQEHVAAIGLFERALKAHPSQLDAIHNKGFALAALNRLADALVCYDEALRINPRHAEALNNRGIALYRFDRFHEAISAYDAALAVRGDDANVLINRAHAFAKINQYRKAIADCERALAIDAEHPCALGDLAFYRMFVCNWEKTPKLPMVLERAIVAGSAIVEPFVFVALPVSAAEHLRYTRIYVERQAAGRPVPSRHSPSTSSSQRKIKLAYLSSDFYRHPTAWLIAELIERHDRSQFEVIGISYGPDDNSEIRHRLARSFDQFHDVRFQSDNVVAKLLYDLGVDIAVDLKGHTDNARPHIFAARAAAVQVNFLGYPATTGCDSIDYIIADPVVLPFDQQPHYTEKIVHLPECYQVNDATKVIAPGLVLRNAHGLPEEKLVFCCFNQSYKITPEVFDVWMRLLSRFDGSVFWLLHSNEAATDNLRVEAQARGIDPERLVFAPKVELSQHLARHAAADLFLDTLPCNAHTTASDALWAGLPLLTCLGSTFAGRVAASLLQAIGLPELIAQDIDEYEQLAINLASDPVRLRTIRQKLQNNRRVMPLFDTLRYSRHLEAAYKVMWGRWQRGEGAEGFAVKPIG